MDQSLFCSAFCDGGYDTSDYKKIDPKIGMNEDAVELCKSAQKLGIWVLLDLVLVHMSDEYTWFKNLSKAKPGKYKDHYIWKDSGIIMRGFGLLYDEWGK